MPRSCADAGPWEPFMGYVRGLQCRECKAEYPPVRLAVCESCFGSLEVRYEIDAVRAAFRSDRGGGRKGPHPLLRLRSRIARTCEAPLAATLRRDRDSGRRHV